MFELSKFELDGVETEQQRWLKFFNEAERLDEQALPAWMCTREMTQAMTTLKAFSEKERAYHAYQARQNYLREQRSIQRHLAELREEVERQCEARDREREAKEQEREAKERECTAKEAALAEVERLQRLLEGRQNH